MLSINFENVRDAFFATMLGLLVWLFLAGIGHAQIAVSDPPVEGSTAQAAQTLDQMLPPVQQTAASLTTGGGGGLFAPLNGTLATWTANLNQGINDPGTLQTNFPGWQALTPNAAQTAQQVAQLALNTYTGALAICNAQEQDFANEDAALGQIEGDSSQSTAALQAIQANTEALLAIAQQIQMLRQLQATSISIEVVKASEELNERAAAGATTETSLLLGY